MWSSRIALVHALRVAVRPHYLRAVTVSRGTVSADGVQDSSLPTHASKAARSRHRVTNSTSSYSADFRTSIETNLGKSWT